MPYLKAILVNATDKSNRMLRAKSMECISLVGMAVGKEKFRDDAKQVSSMTCNYSLSTTPPSSPLLLSAVTYLNSCYFVATQHLHNKKLSF